MRFNNLLMAAVATAALAAFAVPASAAPTIVNGSFEQGPNVAPFATLGNGDTSILGWTVGGLGIDDVNDSYWQASDGHQSIDLNGTGQGSISQELSGLTLGGLYTVSFDLAGNPDGGSLTKVAVASDAGSQASVYSFNQIGNTRANMGWVTQEFNFTATSTNATLVFSSAQPGSFGPALDNVRLAGPVPEPATWAMMLMGFGGLGAVLRTRRRQLALAA